jgi:hypothetical protein
MHMRNLAIGYIAFVMIVIGVWLSIIPTQEKVVERLAGQKMVNTVRSLESEILSRYGTVDQGGNLSHKIYTYHNVSVYDWSLSSDQTSMILYFQVGSHVRVKRFGLVVDEYDGPSLNKSIEAYLEGDYWHLNVTSVRDLV